MKNDGTATQVVPERLITSHGNRANAFSVGIEHDGLPNDPNQFTEALYQTSARLTRDICLRHGIPMNRKRIIGHDEVPEDRPRRIREATGLGLLHGGNSSAGTGTPL